MKINVYTRNYISSVFVTRCRTCIYVCGIASLLVVSTLQAQDPTPEPTPDSTPAATQNDIRDEIITFRRVVIIMGGITLGWQTCLLLFKHH